MNVYKYDEKTKEFIGTEEALLDPLETELQGENVYLLPANATFIEPTEEQEGYVNVWNGKTWEQVEDNRGVEYWLSEDKFGAPAREMKELGALPEGATTTAPEQTLEELKAAKIKEAGTLFAQKRDTIRFIVLPSGKNYGFDCASEDITNFMAAYTPLMIEKSGGTGYKVWLNQTNKGLVTLDYADMQFTYDTVRTSQLEAYTWYEAIKVQINACTTKEELDNITLE